MGSSSNKACVLGLGYVGLPTASILANSGYTVNGVDIDPDVVARVNSGKSPLGERGLKTLVAAAVRSGNLVASLQVQKANVFIICVPTPVRADKQVDLDAVRSAARSIVPVLRRGNKVILESTSPVGTTRNIVGTILKESGLEPGKDFSLCYCPERVLPGNTLAELVGNDRIIGGLTKDCAFRGLKIYASFTQGKIELTDDLTAECCKLMENTYRDVNIALANVFARIAEDAGVDAWRAIELANRHPRVEILKPGPGVGGHCIPVDPWFLAQAYPAHTDLLRCARAVNDSQAERLLDRMMATGKLCAGGKLAILGAAYKSRIDDARGSPAGLLSAAAKARGIECTVDDPRVKPGDYHGMIVVNNTVDCLWNADALVVMNEEYAYLFPDTLAQAMRGRLIGDARNVMNHEELRRAGFEVVVIGNGVKHCPDTSSCQDKPVEIEDIASFDPKQSPPQDPCLLP